MDLFSPEREAREGVVMIDMIPAWFWIPAAIVLWPLAVVAVTVRVSSASDPYDDVTALDVLERTGVHPHGGA